MKTPHVTAITPGGPNGPNYIVTCDICGHVSNVAGSRAAAEETAAGHDKVYNYTVEDIFDGF